jgi:hypothetical protein
MRKSFILFSNACLWATLAISSQAVEVAHYEFEGTLGDSATADGSQDLTLFGDAILTAPGIVGDGKLSLDGSGDYATATGTNAFTSGVAGVTVSTWFTTATIMSNTQQVILQMPITGGASLAQSAVGLEISSGKLQVGGRSSTAEGFQFNDATLPSNTLTIASTTTYFAAATIDYTNDIVTAYLYDGIEWKTQSVEVNFINTTGPGNLGLNIGRRADGQRPFNGGIDDVRISTTALTEAELQALVGYVPPPSGLGGDYNDDGFVDAADYTVWRNNLGGDESARPVEDGSD